ncbi:hypothetical protein BDZ97DRAFT_1283230 [Flammula alnicola]|nr:hypothetical protein BDZ97DRAFT_1283230 [Flammula alnicola]
MTCQSRTQVACRSHARSRTQPWQNNLTRRKPLPRAPFMDIWRSAEFDGSTSTSLRTTSDRKDRRASAAAINDGKRKQLERPSVVHQQQQRLVHRNPGVHIAKDVVPHDEARTKLRRHAQHSGWRGISAVTSNLSPSGSSSH